MAKLNRKKIAAKIDRKQVEEAKRARRFEKNGPIQRWGSHAYDPVEEDAFWTPKEDWSTQSSTHIAISGDGVTDAAGNTIYSYKGQRIGNPERITSKFVSSVPILANQAKLIFGDRKVPDTEIDINSIKTKTASNFIKRRDIQKGRNGTPIEKDGEDLSIWISVNATIHNKFQRNGKAVQTDFVCCDMRDMDMDVAYDAAFRVRRYASRLASQIWNAYWKQYK
ncbi:MAG: hypothetical protein FWE50_01710 [Alphaproteobacteria bacterium]|nr:hypothetical protein [Alphaproteobacteria bacterium]